MEAIKEIKTMAELSNIYSIHPTQIRRWKQKALEGMERMFSDQPIKEEKRKDELIEELYRQIGQLKVEIDWLKKKMGLLES